MEIGFLFQKYAPRSPLEIKPDKAFLIEHHFQSPNDQGETGHLQGISFCQRQLRFSRNIEYTKINVPR